MFEVYLKGGLGNQLFQFFFGKFIEKKFFTKVRYNTRWFDENLHQNRPFLLDDFINDYEKYNKKLNLFKKITSYRTEKIISHLIKKNYSIPFKFFNGYWQDLFFVNDLKDLKNYFKPEILNKKKISDYYIIHYRKGDYALAPKFHNILNSNYYKKGIDLIGKNKKFFLFSENSQEAEILRSELSIKCEVLKMNELDTFQMIYNAKGGISSNSTFVWWPIYLSDKKKKFWVMPYQWMEKKSIFDCNLAQKDVLII